LYVLDPEVIDIFKGPGELHIESHLCGTGIVPFSGAKERPERLAAIGVEELRGDDEAFVG